MTTPKLSLVSRTSDTPLHAQVRRGILELIQRSPKDATTPIPSEAELMATFGVSRITVRRALSDLAAAGYIHRRAGKGSFALPRKLHHTSGRIGGASDEFRQQGFDVNVTVLELTEAVPPEHVAVLFGLSEGQTAQFARRVLRIGDKPISHVSMYFNLPDTVRLSHEEVEKESFLEVLRRKWGIAPARATRTIEAGLATEEDAELLELTQPAAVLMIELIGYDGADRSLFHINVRYDSAYYKYVQDVTAQPET